MDTSLATYLVTEDALAAAGGTPSVVEAAIAGGVDMVQLREKERTARERYSIGREVRAICAAAGVPMIVNDRIDLAMALEADGVHLGADDVPVTVARELLGPDAIVGRSVDGADAAAAAAADGADYVGVGAVYETQTKAVSDAQQAVGPDRIAAIATQVAIPIVGIGGITPDSAGAVIDAGAAGVAVVSAIMADPDPQAATRRLQAAVAEAR
jgi:thiamine-phosphate pyrophosphorylase